ncbi:hypothetical protein JCM11641_000801 [Rhodosporidiobolus odoratus]
MPDRQRRVPAALPYAAAVAVPYALVKRDADSDFADATKAAETLGANAAEAIRKTGRCEIKTLCSQNAAVISSGIASTATASSTIPAASAIVGAEAKSGASSFKSRYSLSGIAAGVLAGGAVLML